jgi:hypothetical protein
MKPTLKACSVLVLLTKVGILVAMSTFAVFGQSPTPTPPVDAGIGSKPREMRLNRGTDPLSIAIVGEREFVSTEGGFKIALPKATVEEIPRSPGKNEKASGDYRWEFSEGGQVYIEYIAFDSTSRISKMSPAELKEALSSLMEKSIAGAKGTKISDESLTVDSYYERKATIKTDSGPILLRIFLSQERSYILIGAMPNATVAYGIEKALDSFKIQ